MSFIRPAAGTLALSVTALAIASAPQQLAPTTQDGALAYTDGVTSWRVDTTTVSVRFAAPASDLATLKRALGDQLAASRIGRLTTKRTNKLGWHDLTVPAGVDIPALLAELRASDLVLKAEPSLIGTWTTTPNDSRFDEQWALNNTGQTGGSSGADMGLLEAWKINAGSAGVIVAVIDSGTLLTHEDLTSNIWTNTLEIDGNNIDDDNNGFIDDRSGWNFGDDNNNPTTSGSHGTFVAGAVAATRNNGIGVSGIAGGTGIGDGARMMPLAVGSFSPIGSAVDDAIIYAADNGAKIITLSLSVGQSDAIDDAVAYAHDVKGCFITCAAGNGGGSVSYPATLERIMAIGATDDDDDPANFSNPGPEVEVSAPGVDVLLTNLSGGYSTNSGTSFSSPYVAGLAALILSEADCLSNEGVRQLIIDTVDDVHNPGFDNKTGWGRVDAAKALMAAREACCPADADGDGQVGLGDLNLILATFGACTVPDPLRPGPCVPGAGDITRDGVVDLADLNMILSEFGQICP